MAQREALDDDKVRRFSGGNRYESGKRKGELKDYDVLWDTELPGFGIRYSTKSKTKTFIFQHRVAGVMTDTVVTIGRFGKKLQVGNKTVMLDVTRARAEAIRYRDLMADGKNPNVERKEHLAEVVRQDSIKKAQRTTLREVLQHFLEHHRTKHGPLRPATQSDYRRHCEKNLTTWLDEPIADVSWQMCLDKHKAITDRGAPIQANLCLDYFRALWNHGKKMNRDKNGRSSAFVENPVTLMYELRKRNPEKAREDRVPLEKIGAVWNRLRELASDPKHSAAADWACLILTTGLRARESATLEWPNVDLDAKTMTFASELTKTHAKLTLPISASLHDILSARKPKDATGYVFAYPSKRGHIWPDTSTATWDEISRIAGTPTGRHSLRRTCEDIAVECKIDSDVRRMVLNHVGHDVHSRHYSNNRRALPAAIEAIAAWVTMQGKIAAGANVVSLPLPAQRETG